MKYRRNRNKKLNSKTFIIVLVIALCLLVVGAGAILVSTLSENAKQKKIEEQTQKQQQPIEEVKEEVVVDVEDLSKIEALISEKDRKAIELYDNYASYNQAVFKGIIQFESGLIEQPFVQSVDNDFFLRRDWISGGYSVMGSIFMDYECSLDSQNLILYGHNAYSSWYAGKDANGNELINDELMFTPLKFLTEKSNYTNNKYVNLILKNEVRQFEIVSVYYCMLTGEGEYLYPDESLQYYLPEYSNDYFKTYKNRISQVEFYNTGVSYSNSDRFLTLQTCVEGNSLAREIVLCKQIGSYSLDRSAYAEYNSRIEKRNETLKEAGINPDEYNQK